MPLHLQERDVAILVEIGELGLLDSMMIHRRHWPAGSGLRACQQRLKLLSDAGLIIPTPLQVAKVRAGSSGGTIPTIYGLTPPGAEVVESETGLSPRRVQRGDLKPITLLHRLEMIHARLGVDDAARQAGLRAPSWIMEYDCEPLGPSVKSAERRFLLHQRFTLADGHVISCRPDASSLLMIPRPTAPAEFDPLVVYWELDRSTNAHSKELAKAEGYEELLRQAAYRRHWPGLASPPTLRVFYVCRSTERVAELRRTFATVALAQSLRFALAADLVPNRVLTDPIWSDTHGKTYQLLRRPPSLCYNERPLPPSS